MGPSGRPLSQSCPAGTSWGGGPSGRGGGKVGKLALESPAVSAQRRPSCGRLECHNKVATTKPLLLSTSPHLVQEAVLHQCTGKHPRALLVRPLGQHFVQPLALPAGAGVVGSAHVRGMPTGKVEAARQTTPSCRMCRGSLPPPLACRMCRDSPPLASSSGPWR